jgi:hypothetical protein
MPDLKIGRRTFLKLGGGSIAATAASALALRREPCGYEQNEASVSDKNGDTGRTNDA